MLSHSHVSLNFLCYHLFELILTILPLNYPQANYWTIKNSWGPKWGEDGSIRILRAADGEKEECYIDDEPFDGSACKDDPHGGDPYTVCGCVGVLSDSVVPTGVKVVRRP